MSGSFRARDSLGCKDDSHKKKKGKKFTVIDCLGKAATLLNASIGNTPKGRIVCQKIDSICKQIEEAYGDKIPVITVKNQSLKKLIEAVKKQIANDGTISGDARVKIIKGLNEVLAMING